MTDQDKRRQKADLLLEFEELKEHIAHLNEAAHRQKERIYTVSKWLEESRFFEHSAQIHRFDEIDAKINQSPEEYRLAMDFDGAAALVKELGQARAKFSELKKRKEALGLK